jgi:hypothetical protein
VTDPPATNLTFETKPGITPKILIFVPHRFMMSRFFNESTVRLPEFPVGAFTLSREPLLIVNNNFP